MAETPNSPAALVEPDSERLLLFVGRQAIVDRDLRVVAYELLYRSSRENRATIADGDRATATVLMNTFLEIGIDVVAFDKPVFVNLGRGFLLEDLAKLFPPARVVVEILESVDADDALIDRVAQLKKAGYTIVLDDFVFRRFNERLLPHADIIKIDVLDCGREKTREMVEHLSKYPGKILAEKIETREDYDFYRGLGFHYFQGYFLEKPVIVSSERPSESRLALFQLLGKVNDPEITIAELEEAVSRDVAIAWRLMRYINSAAFALKAKIESIRHAIMLMGRAQMRNWVNLVVLAGAVGKSSEILSIALVRAAMCDALARIRGLAKPESFFTAGLFSVLDAMMRQPMSDILALLPLSDEIADAMRDRSGRVGTVLAEVVAYQNCTWANCNDAPAAAPDLMEAWSHAVRWAARFLAVEDE